MTSEIPGISNLRIKNNSEGEIISHELHPPFSYLFTLIAQKDRENEEGSGSEFVTLGAQKNRSY